MPGGLDVEVNYWGVLLAAVASMPIGALWYSPSLFGEAWIRLTGVQVAKAKASHTPLIFLWVFLASLFTAYVLAHGVFFAQRFFGGSYLECGMSTAFWVSLGYTGVRIFVHDAFEGRPIKLTLINAGHELVTLLVMGICIGILHP